MTGGGTGGGVRYLVERIALAVTATTGLVVLLADILGWLDELAPGATLSKITLLILSTVTLFLLFEVDRLRVLDNVNEQLSKLDIEGLARERRTEHFGGVVKVHDGFPEGRFSDFLRSAVQEVVVLQTWIPNLHRFEAALRTALVERGVQVRILLLHPASPVAQLRDEALRTVRDSAMGEDVQASVHRSLSILAHLHNGLDEPQRDRLQVRVYNSLPSVAVYKADEQYLVSSFLHGQLAIDSTQMEIEGTETQMGRKIQAELDTLWGIGCDVDLSDWRGSVSIISL
ncbi:hypothetical protein HUT18_20745 [Streptomyces sp. NA04227]|uniref:hypothetical protein n=1 Tax=Streptomyces sp. NA04227 TaxID=2742136 RepID=UPI0015907E88|nr:hypothetical protein [Streptomyces sp. NA04227]QKW08439.1 hypothetical protein HUT18_20745 [Streptomyces sp. NA04227]